MQAVPVLSVWAVVRAGAGGCVRALAAVRVLVTPLRHTRTSAASCALDRVNNEHVHDS
jgi:hypothetical protein